MKPEHEINYRERAASTYLAKKRKQSRCSDFYLFLFLSVVLLTILVGAAYFLAHAY